MVEEQQDDVEGSDLLLVCFLERTSCFNPNPDEGKRSRTTMGLHHTHIYNVDYSSCRFVKLSPSYLSVANSSFANSDRIWQKPRRKRPDRRPRGSLVVGFAEATDFYIEFFSHSRVFTPVRMVLIGFDWPHNFVLNIKYGSLSHFYL